MFVHPSQVADVVAPPPRARPRARLVVEGEMANDRMTLQGGVRQAAPRAWPTPWRAGARRHQAAREVQLAAPGSLPNDGKVIEDARTLR
jgi:phenylacetate-CoA ligase